MGIHGLAKVIGDYAPSAVKENEIKNYFGKLNNPPQLQSAYRRRYSTETAISRNSPLRGLLVFGSFKW